MYIRTAIAATIVVAASSPVFAQGVTGGSLGIEYSVPTNLNDFGQTVYSGALEYGINRNFSVSADLSGYKFDNISTEVSSATLHGTYHMSDSMSVGAFYGQDNLDGATADIYGAEIGTEIAGGTVEGYIGKVDGDSDGVMLGADGTYALQNGFSVIGGFNHVSIDGGTSAGRISVGGAYEMENGPQFYAEVGQMSADTGTVSQSETYVGLGARVAFGTHRGTTFDKRSIFEILPSF